jgi:radical SAM superfamily enzyme with C-terminal helix-hairpin-helix motif
MKRENFSGQGDCFCSSVMRAKAWIIDGYVDEPACLGVPPYVSPYVRTVAGVFSSHEIDVTYHTIDQIRTCPGLLREANSADYLVIIAGMTVPGKSLGGTPATWQEIEQIGSALPNPHTFLGGPILFGAGKAGGHAALSKEFAYVDTLLEGSPAGALDRWFSGEKPTSSFSYEKEDVWAARGACIIRQHPCYPYVMCEIETARGCSRQASGGCSFCTEPFYGRHSIGHYLVLSMRYQHLQMQEQFISVWQTADILTWQAGTGEFPKPRPERLEELFSSIRRTVPRLATLHIDNVNPGTVALHPHEAYDALCTIVRHHTPGDVAAFGMETADPVVIEENNLKATPDMVLDAIQIVQQAGGARRDGIPELLPGLNFIAGLAGETKNTYQLNRQFLETVLKKGFLIRRVNIRQLMPCEGTDAYHHNALPVPERVFHDFKEWTRKHFDLPMLRKVFPIFTILHSVSLKKRQRSPSADRWVHIPF